jgi:fatty acid desaturase
MHLRFAKDRRTLVWAFGLFPLVPILLLWSPRLAVFVLPLALYASYCAGVLTHNHTHVPLFRERAWNRFYADWLSFFYGCPIFAWLPTHHRNHHRYVNGPDDYTRTTRYSTRNSLWSALSYPLRSTAWQWPHVRDYAIAARKRGGAAYRDVLTQTGAVVFGQLALIGLALYLHGAAGALALFGCFTVPALLAPAFMMFTNYVQHVGCDPASPHDHSRNFVNEFANWFIFDNGYHSAHHDDPGLHWSLLRRAHAERAALISPHLNQDTVFAYCLREYLIDPVLQRVRGGANMPQSSASGAAEGG